MNKGQVDNAVRRALNILDSWVDVTGFVQKETGYYWELQGIIHDAVHCGIQGAMGINKPLPSEEDIVETTTMVSKITVRKKGKK